MDRTGPQTGFGALRAGKSVKMDGKGQKPYQDDFFKYQSAGRLTPLINMNLKFTCSNDSLTFSKIFMHGVINEEQVGLLVRP